MKLGKKSIMALSFAVGACVFVSTALADMALGTGYDRLKNSVKSTAAQMEEGLGSYTVQALFTVKDNDQALLQISMQHKADMQLQATESSTVTQSASGETTSNYSYNDPRMSVWKSDREDKYYMTEFADGYAQNNRDQFASPFNQQGAPEIEKIVDALVGNLKDYVQAEDIPEGGKVYSGSLSEAQVPAVVNAVASFGIKQMIADQNRREQQQLPEIESDIYVKKVLGTAIESKAGLLESLTGDVILAGKDKAGVPHDLAVNVVFKLTDVGSTKVATPDLNGANVEKVSPSSGFSGKHVGTYKNNIVIEKDGQFVKIGQRVLEIAAVEAGNVTGRYYETVQPGFEADYPDAYDFTFDYKADQSKSMPLFTYTNAKGETESGQLHPSSSGKIYLNLNIEIISENSYRSNTRPNFDGEFNRVFAE